MSENITVTSIVGRFLEHSRIFYFRNGGNEEVYLGSADLMPRNLNRRVEVDFPVQDKNLIRVIRDEILGTYLKEQAKARHMNSDGKVCARSGLRQEECLEQPGNFPGPRGQAPTPCTAGGPQIITSDVSVQRSARHRVASNYRSIYQQQMT